MNPPHLNDLLTPNAPTLATASTPESAPKQQPPLVHASTLEDVDEKTRELLQKGIVELDSVIVALTHRRNQNYLLLQEVNARIQAKQATPSTTEEETT